jgi:hypothetical protein
MKVDMCSGGAKCAVDSEVRSNKGYKLQHGLSQSNQGYMIIFLVSS